MMGRKLEIKGCLHKIKMVVEMHQGNMIEAKKRQEEYIMRVGEIHQKGVISP